MTRPLKWVGYGILVFLLCSVAWLHFVGRINLTTADLGRHIRNGELALVDHRIISTNHYAYTYPDFPTICHHWGAGVIFYLIWKTWGFPGLSIFYGAVLWATWAIFMGIAARASSVSAALLAGAFVLPLLGYRVEIRPEGFTTLFLGISFLLLYAHRRGWMSGRWLWAIPIVHLAWVNVHILFVIGLCLIAIFALDALVTEGFGRRFKLLVAVGLASAVLSCVNPFGLSGFLAPFNIFKVYGYQLAENQSVPFMIKRFPGRTIYEYFLVIMAAAWLLWIVKAAREGNWRKSVLHGLLLGFFGLMAFKAVRAISMFGLFFIPIAAECSQEIITLYGGKWVGALRRVMAFAAAGVVVLAAVVPYFYLSPMRKYASLIDDPRYRNSLFYVLSRPAIWGDVAPGVNGSADFFKANGLKGPVFNNYDIGGYFIFHFFPGERPFVDNRPEAYPVDFFQKIYGPMQSDDKVWDKIDGEYGFQLIYFYRHDMTEWGQPFLIRRLDDPRWAPIFVDGYTIILARRGGVNQGAIDRYQLPREMFSVTKNQ